MRDRSSTGKSDNQSDFPSSEFEMRVEYMGAKESFRKGRALGQILGRWIMIIIEQTAEKDERRRKIANAVRMCLICAMLDEYVIEYD